MKGVRRNCRAIVCCALAGAIALLVLPERLLRAEPVREQPTPPAIEEPLQIRAKTQGTEPPAKSTQSLELANPTAPAEPAAADFNLPPSKPLLIVNPEPGAAASEVPPDAGPFLLQLPTQQPEESPMKRTTSFGLSAVLGAAVLGLSAPAALADDKSPSAADVKEQFDKLKAAVDKLADVEKRLSEFEGRSAQSVTRLQSDLATAKETIRTLQQDVAFLKDQIRGMKGEPYIARRIEGNGPPAPGAPAVPVRNAQLRLINDYIAEVGVVVNGVSYRLIPGQQVQVTVPAGTLNYQVLGVQPTMQTRLLGPDEIKDIRIHVAP
jgi:hypothetical protein